MANDNKNLEALQEKVNLQEELIAEYEEKQNELQAQIAELREQLNNVPAAQPKRKKKLPVPEKEFTVDKVKYRFRVAQFRKDGKIIKAVDALENRELLKEIVENHAPLVVQA